MLAIPYLGFDGNCAEAMRFYESVLGGKLEIMMTGRNAPPGVQMPQEWADRILHARLALPGGGYLYAGDSPPQRPFPGIQGVSVTLTFDTPEESQEIFDKLCAGGKATMPMAASFWAKRFGMLTDRFGVPWIINGGLII